MDVIINNATPAQAAAPQFSPTQFTPMQAMPYGYGPQGYGPGFGHHHDGPGFGFFVLLGAGLFLLARGRRKRQLWRRMGRGGPPALIGAGAAAWDRDTTPSAARPQAPGTDEWRDTLRRGKQKLLGDSALEIARERYARGEINEADYRLLIRTLMDDGSGAGQPEKDQASTQPGQPGTQPHSQTTATAETEPQDRRKDADTLI